MVNIWLIYGIVGNEGMIHRISPSSSHSPNHQWEASGSSTDGGFRKNRETSYHGIFHYKASIVGYLLDHGTPPAWYLDGRSRGERAVHPAGRFQEGQIVAARCWEKYGKSMEITLKTWEKLCDWSENCHLRYGTRGFLGSCGMGAFSEPDHVISPWQTLVLQDPNRLVACALHGQAPKKSTVLELMIRPGKGAWDGKGQAVADVWGSWAAGFCRFWNGMRKRHLPEINLTSLVFCES